MYSKTTLPIFQADFEIGYSDHIYRCGSCFADEIGKKLETLHFKVHTHPFGIVYSPLAMVRQFDRLLSGSAYQAEELIFQDGLYHSMDHHGSYSHADKTQVLHSINAEMELARAALKSSSILILSFGTSFDYRFLKTQQIVANCHKIPSTQFQKELGELDHMLQAFTETLQQIRRLNPGIRFLLTVSPVRYLREGFIANNRSKARLLLLCEALCGQFDSCFYFPSYEIVMDDLRDYRYVSTDLVHPNQMAIDYIFSYFEHAFFTTATQSKTKSIREWNQLIQHRILNPSSSSYTAYQEKLHQKYLELKPEFPELELPGDRG